MIIRDNLEQVQHKIRQAARRSGREESAIQLLGVTKYASDEEVQKLFDAGLGVFGENRIQDATKRIERFPDAKWHFIGSLQTNKVRFCEPFDLIHSLDRWSLAKALNARAKQWGKLQSVLIQVNVAGEASKSGLDPSEVKSFTQRVLLDCPNLQVRGIMTMAPFVEAEETRPIFRETKRIYDSLQQELGVCWDTLSMGMTNDFEVAIEEGATLVRIGSALFAKEDKDE